MGVLASSSKFSRYSEKTTLSLLSKIREIQLINRHLERYAQYSEIVI